LISFRSLCALAIAGLSFGCIDSSDDPPSPGVDPAACDPSIPSGWRSVPSSTTVGFKADLSNWDSAVDVYAWTGTEVLAMAALQGAVFSPDTGAWRRIADPPGAVSNRWAWSGDTLFVSGEGRSGSQTEWHAYHLATDTWEILPQAPMPLHRRSLSVVWSTTTEELLVWGGMELPGSVDDPHIPYGGGAAYDPAAGTWRTLAPAPISARGYHAAVWNGSMMIVLGGSEGPDSTTANDGAAYDPVTDTWTPIATPTMAPRADAKTFLEGSTGTAAIFWGGLDDMAYHAEPSPRLDGGIYDAVTDSWTQIPSLEQSPLGSARDGAAVWAGAGRLWMLGGTGWTGPVWTRHDDGIAYDLTSGTWSAIPAGLLGNRSSTHVVWTGCEAIFYGGRGATSYLTDGAIYRP